MASSEHSGVISRAGSRREVEAWALFAFSLVVSGAFVAAELFFLDGHLGFPLDDSWIHLAFGRALAAGEGLAIDVGHPVAGSTAPLWTALFALWVGLPGSAIAWAKGAGALLQAVVVVLARGLARDLGLSRSLAALAGLLVALTGWLGWAAVSGMEIPLFTALTLAGMRLHLRERADAERAPLSLAVFGLAAITRPEGLLLVALGAVDRLFVFRAAPEAGLDWRRPGRPELVRLAGGLGLALVAVLPAALYYYAIGGSPLPTTLEVKTGHVGGAGLPSLRYLAAAFEILLRPLPWALVLAPAGAIALVRRLGTRDDRGLLPALWLAGLPFAYACLDSGAGVPVVGNFGRYLFPLFPLVAVLGVLGMAPLAAAIGARRSPVRLGLALVAAAAVLAPTTADAVRTSGLYAQNVANVEYGDVAMARWLAGRLPPRATLAVVDLGAAAALLPNPIVDLAGIASPRVGDFVRGASAEGKDWQYGIFAFLEEAKPDYVLVFPSWLSRIEAPGSPYEKILAIEVPANITLAGDVIALYRTPWTRYPLRAGSTPSGSSPDGAPAAAGEPR